MTELSRGEGQVERRSWTEQAEKDLSDESE